MGGFWKSKLLPTHGTLANIEKPSHKWVIRGTKGTATNLFALVSRPSLANNALGYCILYRLAVTSRENSRQYANTGPVIAYMSPVARINQLDWLAYS